MSRAPSRHHTTQETIDRVRKAREQGVEHRFLVERFGRAAVQAEATQRLKSMSLKRLDLYQEGS